jgi:tRNA threonylcarbamoyladenosine biosynthesis protein TsaE
MTKVPLSELPEFVRNIRAILKLQPLKQSATVVFLKGDLGAGKTTFVQMLAQELGIREVVASPTYVLMKSYRVPTERTQFGEKRRFLTLVHIDAYRLSSAQEFAALKPQMIFADPQTLVCIEWPEHIEGALSEPDLTIEFSSDGAGEGERYIEVA